MLINKLEEIIEKLEEDARQAGFRDGYWRGIFITIAGITIANVLLLSPFLSEKLLPFEASNFTQCLAVRPEQACRTYCNSPTFLR